MNFQTEKSAINLLATPSPHKAFPGEISLRKGLREDLGPEGLRVFASSLLQDVSFLLFSLFFLPPPSSHIQTLTLEMHSTAEAIKGIF